MLNNKLKKALKLYRLAVEKGVQGNLLWTDFVNFIGEDKMSDFEIISETLKAFRIKKDGFEFWIPKNWIKKDGCLGKKALAKLEDLKTEALENKKNEETFELEPVWESERAIAVDVSARFGLDDTMIRNGTRREFIRVRVFIAKSSINGLEISKGKFNWYADRAIKEQAAEGYFFYGIWGK